MPRTPIARAYSRLIAPVAAELDQVSRRLREVLRPEGPVGRGADHFLGSDGKLLRPACVLLASRFGSPNERAVLDLAFGIELVHGSTLLHDDVIDRADTRRGRPSVRRLEGDGVSLLAGDLLLVEGLESVRRAQVPGTLGRLHATLRQMVVAESIQLQLARSGSPRRGDYWRVAHGKAASLFRWGLTAGARAGGLDRLQLRALDRFGSSLGVAFQLTDDLLDVEGASGTGKKPFADLYDGRLSYPILRTLEIRPDLAIVLRRLQRISELDARQSYARVLAEEIRDAGALDATRSAISRFLRSARKALDELPAAASRDSLGELLTMTSSIADLPSATPASRAAA